jgi:hypothetical protein
MKTSSLFVRTAVAAVVSFAAHSAHAIPITFTFSGTVQSTETIVFNNGSGSPTYDYSQAGQAFSAWITIDTDGLVRSQGTDGQGIVSLQLNDLASDPAEWTTSGLTIAGIDYDVQRYARDYGQIAVTDFPGPVCTPSVPEICYDRPDYVNISDRSADYSVSNAPDGQFDDVRLNFSLRNLLDPNGVIDLTQLFEATDLLTLPLTTASATYAIVTRDCLNGGCVSALATSTLFQVDTWSITTPTSANNPSVPEPATLALFAVGLLGTAAARRKSR